MNYNNFLSFSAQRALNHPPPGNWVPSATSGVIPLHKGYPFQEAIPAVELVNSAHSVQLLEGNLPLHYQGSSLAPKLGNILTAWSQQRGIFGSIIITSGILQALELALRVLVDSQDVVVLEQPTYMECLEVVRNYTDQIIGYPVDEHGVNVETIEQDLRQGRKFKILYINPSFQNPSGTCLSEERRIHLRALASEFDFLILEDDAYGELGFDFIPNPVAQGSEHVIYLGSLSKIVAPGIRVGWAMGPKPLIQAMSLFQKDQAHPYVRATVCHYLENIDLNARLKWLRNAYAQRANEMVSLLSKYMPSRVTWRKPKGGFFVWLHTPGVNTKTLLKKAMTMGVSYVPGCYFYHQESGGKEYLRLSFCTVSSSELRKGVKILGDLLAKELAT